MLVKVLKTTKASKNQSGIEVFEYLQGETYDIYQDLAGVFIREGWGEKAIDNLKNDEEINEEKALNELENKAIDNLENKEFKSKRGNKNAK